MVTSTLFDSMNTVKDASVQPSGPQVKAGWRGLDANDAKLVLWEPKCKYFLP